MKSGAQSGRFEAIARPPRVSIIVPAFNAARHLDATIRRLLHQTYENIEIVVVDDGSADDTARIGTALEIEFGPVRFFANPQNLGVAKTRERAASESSGKYVWFVDADDLTADVAVEQLVDAAERTGADVVVCSATYLYGNGSTRQLRAPKLTQPIAGHDAFRMILEGRISGHLWNKLFLRDAAVSIDYTPARVHSDLAMVAQLVANARTVVAVPESLYTYIARDDSLIRTVSRRAESLDLVRDAVLAAAVRSHPTLLSSREMRYFQLRFITLSGFKDAVLGPYESEERARLLRARRSELRWRSLMELALRGDWKRLLLAVSAKLSTPLYRRALRLAAN